MTDNFQDNISDPLDMGGFNYPQRDDGLTKWTLDPSDVISVLELQMLGLKMEGNQIVKYRKEPMMSREGIARIIFLLQSHINKNNVLGRLKKEETYKIVRKCCNTINELMFINRKQWGLSREDWKLLNVVIPHQIFIFLTRPIDGAEQK